MPNKGSRSIEGYNDNPHSMYWNLNCDYTSILHRPPQFQMPAVVFVQQPRRRSIGLNRSISYRPRITYGDNTSCRFGGSLEAHHWASASSLETRGAAPMGWTANVESYVPWWRLLAEEFNPSIYSMYIIFLFMLQANRNWICNYDQFFCTAGCRYGLRVTIPQARALAKLQINN